MLMTPLLLLCVLHKHMHEQAELLLEIFMLPSRLLCAHLNIND